MIRRTSIAAAAALLAATLLSAGAATAGCGCDHPPPDWTVVMPPFGSPNKHIAIYAVNGAFEVGGTYTVDFGAHEIDVVAEATDRVEAVVPHGVERGPVELRVTGPGYDYTYPDSAFTALPHPRRIKNREGVFHKRGYRAAVGADGTLYLALNVKRAKDALQFAFSFRDLPLAYTADDVVIYNADGVDLTLFTLDVTDAHHQWGEYYGWTVETDAGLDADMYEGLAAESDAIATTSDLFTYWRHEFHTYAAAHAPGGSHQTNANGYHPDGTLHVDHYNLVIAIDGKVRDPSNPGDPSLATPLEPGMQRVDLGWLSIRSDAPIDLSGVAALIGSTDEDWAEELEEILFEEGDD